MSFVDHLVNRQQLHRSDAKFLQVLDACGVRETGIGATKFFGHGRISLGETFDVHFIDDGFGEWGLRRSVVSPVELAVD